MACRAHLYVYLFIAEIFMSNKQVSRGRRSSRKKRPSTKHNFGKGRQLGYAAYSRPRLPLIPDEACHPFHAKAATDSTAKLPPWQAA